MSNAPLDLALKERIAAAHRGELVVFQAMRRTRKETPSNPSPYAFDRTIAHVSEYLERKGIRGVDPAHSLSGTSAVLFDIGEGQKLQIRINSPDYPTRPYSCFVLQPLRDSSLPDGTFIVPFGDYGLEVGVFPALTLSATTSQELRHLRYKMAEHSLFFWDATKANVLKLRDGTPVTPDGDAVIDMRVPLSPDMRANIFKSFLRWEKGGTNVSLNEKGSLLPDILVDYVTEQILRPSVGAHIDAINQRILSNGGTVQYSTEDLLAKLVAKIKPYPCPATPVVRPPDAPHGWDGEWTDGEGTSKQDILYPRQIADVISPEALAKVLTHTAFYSPQQYIGGKGKSQFQELVEEDRLFRSQIAALYRDALQKMQKDRNAGNSSQGWCHYVKQVRDAPPRAPGPA